MLYNLSGLGHVIQFWPIQPKFGLQFSLNSSRYLPWSAGNLSNNKSVAILWPHVGIYFVFSESQLQSGRRRMAHSLPSRFCVKWLTPGRTRKVEVGTIERSGGGWCFQWRQMSSGFGFMLICWWCLFFFCVSHIMFVIFCDDGDDGDDNRGGGMMIVPVVFLEGM